MNNTRLNILRDRLKEKDMDGALVLSDTNRNYITGFTGNESYILVTQKEALFITDSRFTEQAKDQTVGFDVLDYKGNLVEFLSQNIISASIKKLGFEENFVTYGFYEELRSKLDNIEFVKLNNMIEQIRQIKDEEEIKNIEKAASIADDAFSHIVKYIKIGMTEKEIGLELEHFMKLNGASGLSFPSIIVSGKRASLPHGTATEKKIEYGDFLTLDFGCIYNGYCSDMTRTIFIGKASDRQKEIYNIVLEANEKVLEQIRPNITGQELDKIARNLIEERGYGECFGHGLGHGVGMDIHELPTISRKGKESIAANMVITDEPGIYIPNFGGVRIEDLILVTSSGHRVLSKSDKNIIEINNWL